MIDRFWSLQGLATTVLFNRFELLHGDRGQLTDLASTLLQRFNYALDSSLYLVDQGKLPLLSFAALAPRIAPEKFLPPFRPMPRPSRWKHCHRQRCPDLGLRIGQYQPVRSASLCETPHLHSTFLPPSWSAPSRHWFVIPKTLEVPGIVA